MELDYQWLFKQLASEAEQELADSGERNKEHAAIVRAVGWLKFEVLCLEARQQYSTPWTKLQGLDAARYLVLKKHSWPIEKVRALDRAELMFVLVEELKSLDLPQEAKQVVSAWALQYGAWGDLKDHLSDSQA